MRNFGKVINRHFLELLKEEEVNPSVTLMKLRKGWVKTMFRVEHGSNRSFSFFVWFHRLQL